MAAPRKKARRNRRWEEENPPTSYRIDPEINERIKGIKETLLAGGFRATTSAIAEVLLLRGLQAWDDGEELEFWGVESAPTARTYRRNGD